MREPWYRDGLGFACTRCGNCCTGAPGYVWLNSEEIEEIARHRGESRVDFSRQFVRLIGTAFSLIERPNGDCIFYDREGKGCSIYAVRPTQCRTWPFWESNLRTKATWDETCRVCPGAGTGDLVSVDEIQRRATAIRL